MTPKHRLPGMRAVAALFFATAPLAANAQPVLAVAYCLGVAHQRFMNYQSALADRPDLRSIASPLAIGAQHEMARLTSLLAGTGDIRSPQTLAAQMVGEADVKRCLAADSSACGPVNRCIDQTPE